MLSILSKSDYYFKLTLCTYYLNPSLKFYVVVCSFINYFILLKVQREKKSIRYKQIHLKKIKFLALVLYFNV